MSAARKSTRPAKRAAPRPAGPSSEKLVNAAEKTLWDLQWPLLTLSEIGERLRDCPYTSNTMWCVVEILVDRAKDAAQRLPMPTDAEVATAARTYLAEGLVILEDLRGAARLLEREDDTTVADHPGVAALATAIETLSEKAGALLEAGPRLFGASPTMMCFHKPADFQGTSLKDFRRSAEAIAATGGRHAEG